MGISVHPQGLFRAYKKINGVEHQIYSRDLGEIERKQKKLDSIAALKPRPLFRPDGRLIGVTTRLVVRPGRKPAIVFVLQINRKRKEIRYTGDFAFCWAEVKKQWKAMSSLMTADVAEYFGELKLARRLYMKQVIAHEETIRDLELHND